MIIIHRPSDLQIHLQKLRKSAATIGFVPTMGALHEGHISLVAESNRVSDVTVCSIFVNPTQFNDRSDYNKYPNRIAEDVLLLEKAGTGILYLPSVTDIYSQGTDTLEWYNLGYLETVLEGKYRPGHFQGVCQVMSRLLDHVSPSHLFMGRKDYQQCMVVKRLLELKAMHTMFIACDTVREEDGLAMSSRNLRLSNDQRVKAPHIYRSLILAKEKLQKGDLNPLKAEALSYLKMNGFRTDYFEIATAEGLEIVNSWDGRTPLVALVAAYLGDVRLIDNMEIASRSAFS